MLARNVAKQIYFYNWNISYITSCFLKYGSLKNRNSSKGFISLFSEILKLPWWFSFLCASSLLYLKKWHAIRHVIIFNEEGMIMKISSNYVNRNWTSRGIWFLPRAIFKVKLSWLGGKSKARKSNLNSVKYYSRKYN